MLFLGSRSPWEYVIFLMVEMKQVYMWIVENQLVWSFQKSDIQCYIYSVIVVNQHFQLQFLNMSVRSGVRSIAVLNVKNENIPFLKREVRQNWGSSAIRNYRRRSMKCSHRKYCYEIIIFDNSHSKLWTQKRSLDKVWIPNKAENLLK